MEINMKSVERQYKNAYGKYLSAFPTRGNGRWSEMEAENLAWQRYLCDACDEYMRALGAAYIYALSVGDGGAKFEKLFRQWNEDVQVSLGWKEDPEDVRRREEIRRKKTQDQWTEAFIFNEIYHHTFHDGGD